MEVLIRLKKPCTRIRRRFLGCQVRFVAMCHSSAWYRINRENRYMRIPQLLYGTEKAGETEQQVSPTLGEQLYPPALPYVKLDLHSPVGRSMKNPGIPNSCSICMLRALIPKVSVA